MSCRVVGSVVLYRQVLQLNCDDLLARVNLTFYERSVSRVNRHTLICCLFITVRYLPFMSNGGSIDGLYTHVYG